MTSASNVSRRPHDLRPRCALRVAIVGHRPNRIPENAFAAIDQSLVRALETARNALATAYEASRPYFRDEPPVLSCASGVAEGADQWASRRALAMGAELIAILPFAREEYAKDFAAKEAYAEYQSLLAASAAVIELPGARSSGAGAYRAASDVLLDQADLLLAVWDGGASAGAGGTRDVIDEAARRGLPIISIDAATGALALYWRGQDPRNHAIRGIEDVSPTSDLNKAVEIVGAVLQPPVDDKERAGLDRFLKGEETARRGWEWRLLIRLFGDARSDAEAEPAPTPDPAAAHPSSQRLSRMFSVADQRATLLAEAFRSAYARNFILAALAVVTAVMPLLPLASAIPKPFYLFLELAILFGIWRNTMRGRRAQLLNRWLQSRELAERLRPAPIFWRLAARGRRGNARERTWTGWYAHNLMREPTPWSGALDEAELKRARTALVELARAQQRYHARTLNQHRHLEERLEAVGHGAFKLTFAIALALLLAWFALTEKWQHILAYPATALAAALPAIGSALYGLRLIGDFRSTAERSARTEKDLQNLATLIERDDTDFESLRQIALALADSMLGEVASWRLAAESRPLDFPN